MAEAAAEVLQRLLPRVVKHSPKTVGKRCIGKDSRFDLNRLWLKQYVGIENGLFGNGGNEIN